MKGSNNLKTLVVYATKNGATKVIAEELCKNLKGETDIRNIRDKIPSIKDYDAVIVGGSIYMGKIQKGITSFLRRNKRALMDKKLGLFIGCYTPPDTEGYIDGFFDNELLSHAKTSAILGGIMQYDKMNFVYRKIFMSLKKIDDFNKNFIEPEISYEGIKEFTEVMNS